MLLRLLAGLLLALCPALSSQASDTVRIEVQGEVLKPGPHTLAAKSRLLDALSAARPSQSAFWQGAHYTRRALEAEQTAKKQRLLNQIRHLKDAATAEGETDKAACFAGLAQRLSKLPATGRHNTPIDPNQLELDPSANRRLQDGDRLTIPTRPTAVFIDGFVRHTAKIPFRHGRLASEYLDQVTPCPNADPSFVWLIYPDGVALRVGIAYWNEEPKSLTPGTRIYVPLASSLFADDTDSLNAAIATFLATQPLP